MYLRDIWPSTQEVKEVIDECVRAEMFTRGYADVFVGDDDWRGLDVATGQIFDWDDASTYVRRPPYFDGMSREPEPVRDIAGARVLAVLGDSVTTDHISPAGAIKPDGPAGNYLTDHGVERGRFQLLRLPPRQPRGDDPGHVREYPAAQPARSRHRGRRHHGEPTACRHAIQPGLRSATSPSVGSISRTSLIAMTRPSFSVLWCRRGTPMSGHPNNG